MASFYEQLSNERKEGQRVGDIPEWVITPGWIMLKEKYLSEGETLRERYESIAKAASDVLPKHLRKKANKKFFNLFWNGYLAASTPVLSNTGNKKGFSVSCSGQDIGDSINDIYSCRHETAMLTQKGFGTSGNLSNIRCRGSKISTGGKSVGAAPVFKRQVSDMEYVSQGNTRRGAWAGYLDFDHGDFWEIVNFVYNEQDGANLGINYYDRHIEALKKKDPELTRRFQRHMKLRCVAGKGYMFFPDKVNRHAPQMYKDLGLKVKSSNLCTEITLFADLFHTFTCVLSSMNGAKYDEWKDTDAVFWATVFLDCIAEIFIREAGGIPGMEKAVRFTKKSRALGLGLLGFHTYLQKKNIPLESVDAVMVNEDMFKHLHDESLRASQWMAKELGEPEWCSGYGVRNTHRTAIAPNMSSAMICGGNSQGIEPVYSNIFNQSTAGGEFVRINPTLIDVMKEKGIYDQAHIDDIIAGDGSVQGVDWLTDHEKLVFKTAFEVSQDVLIDHASDRQKWICQAQSLNLFIDSNEEEKEVARIHSKAMLDPNVLSLYYVRGKAGVKGSDGTVCASCEG